MNVPTITMPPEVARAKLKACRTNMHRQVDDQFAQLAKGYEALEKGTPLIDIANIFQDGEFDLKNRPKLAICRADRKEVEYLHRISDREASFFGGLSQAAIRSRSLNIKVPMPLNKTSSIRGYALVPMIPPATLPARGQRKDWHILWEVDAWADRSMTGRAPTDPLLLKHIGGTLYAILAAWDLTPLEQAIMNGALQS